MLRSLETELHQPATRGNAGRLAELLHDTFVEFGQSGRRYDKAATLRELPLEPRHGPVIQSDDYALRRIGPDAALLTYRSAHRRDDGRCERHALRASLWQRTSSGWRMVFHQGTPTAPFQPVGIQGRSD
ncbi:hypothetical protein ASG87_13535 [Frateuria sp. Soil773]|nr:hypothetical protein ASG87_13535 [Frateuria sp. Soil773]